MSRARIVLVLALLAASSVVLPPTARAAVDQLEVSAASGAPGDRVHLAAPSCTDTIDSFTMLFVEFWSGVGSSAEAAGVGLADGASGMTLTVPDWLDPDAPAEFRARCLRMDDLEGSVESVLPAVPFDVLPGGAPTQSAAVDRTSFLVGQSVHVSATGCPDGTAFGTAALGVGSRVSDLLRDVVVGSDSGPLVGSSFDLDLTLHGEFLPDPTPVPAGSGSADPGASAEPAVPGDYLVLAGCVAASTTEFTELLLPPAHVRVTGYAPTEQVTLTVSEDGRSATLEGSGCTQGTVTIDWSPLSGFDDLPSPAAARGRTRSLADGLVRGALRSGRLARTPRAGTTDPTATVQPDLEGRWSVQIAVDPSDDVMAIATCGDPSADGFVYEARAAASREGSGPTTVPESTTSTTSSVPAGSQAGAVGSARGAVAVTARPRFAG